MFFLFYKCIIKIKKSFIQYFLIIATLYSPNISCLFQTGLISYASTFYIRSVTMSDYGYYECVAENELGAQTFSVHFTAPTRPDPPFALKVINTTHDSVTLMWILAFDGGKQQYFRLRYRTKVSVIEFLGKILV